jgi:hypothetical protein
MPIGVPKVPYRMPGDDSALSGSIYIIAYTENDFFFMSKQMMSANQLEIMLYLNSEKQI